MKELLQLLALVLLFTSCSKESIVTINSPDENISVDVFLNENGSIGYQAFIKQDGELFQFIEKSILGLEREDATFLENMKMTGNSEIIKIADSYDLPSGKKRAVSYEANEIGFKFENTDGQNLGIRFRVFNDGIAFRYEFEGEGSSGVLKEYSEFNLPENGRCWSQAYDAVTKYTPAYETFYSQGMDIGTPAPEDKNGWSFPTTFDLKKCWVLISESNLDGSYPASHLESNCDEGIYSIAFPMKDEAMGLYTNTAAFSLPWASPWRVIIAGAGPAELIKSTLITDLADPCKIDDVSWIKPGRAAWSWWSDSDSPQLVREQKRFTKFAAEMGWEYNLIDANWNFMKDGTVQEAIDYANELGIGSLLWYNSGGNHNIVEEAPRDRMLDPDIRKKEFETIANWGAKGVKVDFFQSDKQDIIKQYLGILKDAADNKILVNFHGCTLPRGWNRTWPNMLTLEAVRGGETYKFGKDYPKNAPWHNTVLPFTRNVVGPMDYTPVLFTDHTYPHLTSYGHELATAIVFESGIIHYADKIEAYENLPGEALQLLKEVPAAWDEVHFLSGYPGDYVIIARRHGDNWYIGGLNGRDENRTQTITLDFLKNSRYTLSLICDGENPESFSISEQGIQSGDSLKINFLPFGGFSAILKLQE